MPNRGSPFIDELPADRLERPALVRRLVELLDAQYRQMQLDEPALARMLGISPGHLHRQLRQHLGRTFLDLLHDRRTAEAHRLILDTSKTFYQIAERVGYSSAMQLRRRIVLRYGSTPRELRAGRAVSQKQFENART